jgi:hypothetical protein
MAFSPLRYEPYEVAADLPNVVVDGSPNRSTVLNLTHWPGFPAPEGLAADLSAQMAYRYLERGVSLHGDAEVVTNNHFDQDGVVGVYALSRPDDALARRKVLEDVAAAGDFAIYSDRRAARVSMVLSEMSDEEHSPLAIPADRTEKAAYLYDELLPRLPELVDNIDRYRDIWGEEDDQLTQSEAALAAGDVVITDHPEIDLAVVDVGPDAPTWWGHRFAGMRFHGIHPMALHRATDRFAILVMRGRRYELTYRYETWVQYQSWRPRLRVDLAPLAEILTALETNDTRWQADSPGDLSPQLRPAGGRDTESSLSPEALIAAVSGHFSTAPTAWDPYT